MVKQSLGPPPRGPKRLFVSKNRPKNGFLLFQQRIMITWLLTKLQMITMDWRNVFLGETISGTPFQGPLRAILSKNRPKNGFLLLKQRITITWLLTKLQMINMDWRNVFLGGTIFEAPSQGT